MNQSRLSDVDWIIIKVVAVYVAINLGLSGFFYCSPAYSPRVLEFIPVIMGQGAIVFLVLSIVLGPFVAISFLVATHFACAVTRLERPRAVTSLIVVIASILTSCLDLVLTAEFFAGC